MAGEYRVIITAEALGDIQAIFKHIELTSPQNAASTIQHGGRIQPKHFE